MDNKADPSVLPLPASGLALDIVDDPLPDGGLHRLEMAMLKAVEGLTRWQAGCFEQVSSVPLTGAETTLLLLIGSGGRSKTIKELARATNRIDIPNIQYSLRKLASAGLTSKQGAGRSGVTYSLTAEGMRASEKMHGLRQQLLLQAVAGQPDLTGQLQGAAAALEELAELYGAASRQAEAKSEA
ncbi:winged helix DNA-binding protein [Leisingera sp. ANG-M1]|uniref:winged helix DNA-binding protein n=1 Tax=Leisingera sp. ANG-M1 TaxID=1577895 RepID=UPI001F4C9469|nr:winged helix DNA-binding protein [Leisingera sp. ANG-M1]